MTEHARGTEVWVNRMGTDTRAGTLRSSFQRGAIRTSFEYRAVWLHSPLAFAIDPSLPMREGPQYPSDGHSLFPAFADAAPNRWGRHLIARAEWYAAAQEHRPPRPLFDIDYILGLTDRYRMGALRFRDLRDDQAGTPFLSPSDEKTPSVTRMHEIQAAAQRMESGTETARDVQILLGPGASLGGARPKAVVADEFGSEWIAKFERDQDPRPVPRWEALTLRLAHDAGIVTPRFQSIAVDGRSVFLARRFDRTEDGNGRVPYASAMTLCRKRDGDDASYLEIAGAILQHGGSPREDLRQLWRRMVFGVLVRNTDDHLRNHGFLWDPAAGWRLSPAFDINPTPIKEGAAVHALALDDRGDRTGSLDLVMGVHDYFGLSSQEAQTIIQEVTRAVSQWPRRARDFGLTAADCRHMEGTLPAH
ncbi:type II toxin-antitoxin system HipA family toxin [Thioalkalivibrio sp. ALE14]|uniref:type II toxin-antitoxin system HipA family toxin n=1 Tax=Thioalkalivibrio sp. ALE14 TaxID=1158168 RepID=UPI001E36A20C|nr:type II toxin-antitoxin system HipA family toxin [Thioalkalivibrio sp. ALE14]